MIPIIILAAGQGTRLGKYTENSPKGMVELNGKPLLEWHIAAINHSGDFKITVLGGYQNEKLKSLNESIILNPLYAETNMVESLLCAQSEFSD